MAAAKGGWSGPAVKIGDDNDDDRESRRRGEREEDGQRTASARRDVVDEEEVKETGTNVLQSLSWCRPRRPPPNGPARSSGHENHRHH